MKTIWLTVPKRQCASKVILGVTEETNSVEVKEVGAAKWRVVLQTEAERELSCFWLYTCRV